MQNIEEDPAKKLWEEFKSDIIYKNRYFAGNNIISLLDKFHMSHMFADNTKMEFFRARIGDYSKENISNLLAPPNGKASAGRCNPEGISYLYLSSCIKTATAEVRPNCGDIVSVAKIKVDVSRIFSFRPYFCGLNLPSNPGSEDSLSLIKHIDIELASKVTKEQKLDYIPFQFISEYIKKRGFNGFVYSSTVGPGMNFVMFDWENKFELIEINLIDIKNISYEF